MGVNPSPSFFLPATIFLQARISSSRLPGKVLKRVYGKPLLGYLLDRLLTAGLPVVVLVPRNEKAAFSSLGKQYSEVVFWGGSKHDVLKRFYQAAEDYPACHYIRVTGDNPFTSISCMLSLLKKHIQERGDISYYKGLSYGAGVEIISRRALHLSHRYAVAPYDREHVTSWLHHQESIKIKMICPSAPRKYRRPDLRVTVDTPADFALFRKRVRGLRESGRDFSLEDLLDGESFSE